MTPHRSRRKNAEPVGTLLIDRAFPAVGRIKRASGARSAKVWAEINDMLTDLYYGEEPRVDVLADFKRPRTDPRRREFLEVLPFWKKRQMHLLPTGAAVERLAVAFPAWVERRVVGPDWRRAMRTAWLRLALHVAPDAPVADLPAALRALRRQIAESTPTAFNKTRTVALKFSRAELGKRHPTTQACEDVEPAGAAELRAAPGRRTRNPLPVVAFAAVADALATDQAREALWSLAATGMRPEEYWREKGIDWGREVAPGGAAIRVRGIKSAAAGRLVPDVGRCVEPRLSREALKQQLAYRVETGRIAPFTLYDARRSFAHWAEMAGIPETRRKVYMGHGPKDLTQHYGWHDVAPYVVEDAGRLREYITAQLAARLGSFHDNTHDVPQRRQAGGEGSV